MDYKTITNNGKKLAAHVSLKQDTFGRKVYRLEISVLDDELKSVIEKLEKSFRHNVTPDMRFTDNSSAVQACTDVTIFSVNLLNSNIPDSLKIALFTELNIVGYMFDRSLQSYLACNKNLKKLLEEIEYYKGALSASDIQLWDNSTLAKAENITYYRGVLEGVMLHEIESGKE